MHQRRNVTQRLNTTALNPSTMMRKTHSDSESDSECHDNVDATLPELARRYDGDSDESDDESDGESDDESNDDASLPDPVPRRDRGYDSDSDDSNDENDNESNDDSDNMEQVDAFQLLQAEALGHDSSLEPLWAVFRSLLPESLSAEQKSLVLEAAFGEEDLTDEEKELFSDHGFSDGFVGDSFHDYGPPQKRHRHHYDRTPKEESHWWRMFLCPEKRNEIENRLNNGRLADKFRRAFSVPWPIFEQLRNLAVDEGWYQWDEDNIQVDCCGQHAADLELLLLGALYHVRNAATHFMCHLSTGLSENRHRVFLDDWTDKMAGIKDVFIRMPNDEESLAAVECEYAKVGLIGTVGSVDLVHIGWDGCPVTQLHLYKGKEGFPSVAYLVIGNHRKEIMHVGNGEPGARTDRQAARNDTVVAMLLRKEGFLGRKEWTIDTPDGPKMFVGYYLICDGGFLRWPVLICPNESGIRGSDLYVWSEMVTSERKDIEDVFGILKRRFRCLKMWPTVRTQRLVDNMFVTCCILHNLLLHNDGYTEVDLEDSPTDVQLRFRVHNGQHGENLWIRDYSIRGGAAAAVVDMEDIDGVNMESQWWERTTALAYHYGRAKEREKAIHN